MAWVYIRTEPGLFTVGFYDPDGKWYSDADFGDRDEARARVSWLNGGDPADRPMTRIEKEVFDEPF